jgi:eukaryotic-like serine/threonine-protein kinase
VKRVVFRLFYALLLLAIFLGGAWFSFQKSIVGRSVTVPDLTGKTAEESARIARGVGLQVEEESKRARFDEKIPQGRVLAQSPEAASLAKPSQIVRIIVSLGAAQLKVPDLEGLPPRAAALKLSQQSLQLGTVSWYRDPSAKVGIVAQDPEPEVPVGKNSAVEVLTNRGAPGARYVMPDLIGKDSERMRGTLEAIGFRVGSARYELYEGIAPNTILKQFPPAGYPIGSREVISLTVSRAAETILPSSR